MPSRLSSFLGLLDPGEGRVVYGVPYFIALMTDLPEVRASAHQRFAGLVALPLISVASYLLDGIFIDTLQTRWMQYTMLLGVLVLALLLVAVRALKTR